MVLEDHNKQFRSVSVIHDKLSNAIDVEASDTALRVDLRKIGRARLVPERDRTGRHETTLTAKLPKFFSFYKLYFGIL